MKKPSANKTHKKVCFNACPTEIIAFFLLKKPRSSINATAITQPKTE